MTWPGAAILALAAGLTLSCPATAQNVLSPSASYASEADAVRESVPVRQRAEFAPLGILLGDLLDFGSQSAGSDVLPSLPTPQPIVPTRLRPLDSAESETGFSSRRPVTRTSSADVLGSFILRPRILVDGLYDDNIFRSDQNRRSDFITIVNPSLRLVSDWNNHGLTLAASGTVGRYADFSGEDYEDFSLSAAPRIDVTDRHVLNANLRYARNHEDRTGGEPQLQGTVPSVNYLWNAQTSWTYSGSALSSVARYAFLRQDARDAGRVNRQSQDLDTHTVQWRLGWQFSPGRTLWVQPEYEAVRHRIVDRTTNFDRDNQGWQALAGMTFDLSAVTFLEFGVGYVTRTYDEPARDDYEGPAYRFRTVWNVFPLVTLDLSAGRFVTIEDSLTASASITDQVSLQVAWDPLEQLIVSAALGFSDRDFESLPGFSNEETLYSGSLNLRYLVSPNLFVEANYRYTEFESTTLTNTYTNNQFRLRAGMEL